MKNNRTIILATFTVLAVSLATISLSAFAYAGANTTTAIYSDSTVSGTSGYYHNGMMGGMMGGNWGQASTVQNPILPLIGFVALIGAVLTGAGGTVYYFAAPKIIIAKPATAKTIDHVPKNTDATPYATVAKTLTPEERKVLEVLSLHNGKYLQKYIRAEAGLNRLKTHRIITRLAKRGIVTLEKSGNTNEVRLSTWLQPKT